MLRPKGVPTPCHECPKIPADAPAKTREHAIELTEQNFRAWQHYRRCRAVNRWPNDPIVERNATILRELYDELEARPMNQLLQALLMKGAIDG